MNIFLMNMAARPWIHWGGGGANSEIGSPVGGGHTTRPNLSKKASSEIKNVFLPFVCKYAYMFTRMRADIHVCKLGCLKPTTYMYCALLCSTLMLTGITVLAEEHNVSVLMCTK
jgi:hypothetical protein